MPFDFNDLLWPSKPVETYIYKFIFLNPYSKKLKYYYRFYYKEKEKSDQEMKHNKKWVIFQLKTARNYRLKVINLLKIHEIYLKIREIYN